MKYIQKGQKTDINLDINCTNLILRSGKEKGFTSRTQQLQLIKVKCKNE